jgi:type II secretory pathway component PulF
MSSEEFAFFNRQLAAMLREGIPLEGALKQLCAGMRAGVLRSEFEQLEAELARGTPLKQALGGRNLPEFYKRMVEMGAASNDLPGVLTLLADHYQRANVLWSRLKGLMVYPFLVILVSLGLTLLVTLAFSRYQTTFDTPNGFARPNSLPMISVWLPPIALGLLALAAAAAVSVPAWRARLRWRLPAFREASLAQLASSMALMLKNGATLPGALALAESVEADLPAAKALASWRAQVEAGRGKPSQWTLGARPIPPLFLWLVQKGGEDVAAGFEKAAEIYQGRASYRIEMALYGALPVSVLLLGQMVFWQVVPLMQALVSFMNMVGDTSGGGKM